MKEIGRKNTKGRKKIRATSNFYLFVLIFIGKSRFGHNGSMSSPCGLL